MTALANKAMIVALTVSCWTARKQDKQVSVEVEKAHGAVDAGRYNKLLIDKAYLDPLTSYAGKVRNEHYRLTLPWLDNGGRLLPSKLFFEYQSTMDKLKSEYRKLVEDFVAVYQTQLVPAARNRLGTMYDPSDYPDATLLPRKFGIDIDIMPVPQGEDFRVEVSESERARIQAEIEERTHRRKLDAMADAWARVRNCVELIHLRTSADKPIIRESLMENAQDLVKLLPGLNVLEDPRMTDIAREITDNLLVQTWMLRNNDQTRQEVAKHAARILSMIP